MDVVKENVGHSANVKSGYRLVTAAEARERREEIMRVMEGNRWFIARLAGGLKISGEGYGKQIEESDKDEEFGHSVIVAGNTKKIR